MPTIDSITPCLWFDSDGEDAARFYTAVFPSSRVIQVTRFGEAGREIHGRPAGSVMTVEFELDGHRFTALNGGPLFKLSEAISFQVNCTTQADVDYFWDELGDGGDPEAQQCGWLKDKFGLSWQIVPTRLAELMTDPDAQKRERTMTAMLQMKKLDIAALERAAAG